MTYGALVMQLLKDYEDIAEVNRQLEQMGYNIGERYDGDTMGLSARHDLANLNATTTSSTTSTSASTTD